MKKITLFLGLLICATLAFSQENPCPNILSHGFTTITNDGSNNCTAKVFTNASGDIAAQKGYVPTDSWAAAEDQIEGIRCHQLLEHLDTIIPLMNDCYEVMKPGAEFEISTPYALSEQCWGDPTHKRGYTKDTFQYFVKDSPFQKEKDEYGITANFELVRCEIVDGWNIEVVLRK